MIILFKTSDFSLVYLEYSELLLQFGMFWKVKGDILNISFGWEKRSILIMSLLKHFVTSKSINMYFPEYSYLLTNFVTNYLVMWCKVYTDVGGIK